MEKKLRLSTSPIIPVPILWNAFVPASTLLNAKILKNTRPPCEPKPAGTNRAELRRKAKAEARRIK